jgi:Zn-dependent peptidase ImmA (M78 family)/DNA-binding XRE family transcriptional regulator
MDANMNLSDQLKKAREFAGFTLRDVSEKTGIDDSCISSYENGNTEPKFAQLTKLAEAYRLPISFFFEEAAVEPQLVLWRNKPEREAEIRTEFLELCRQYRQLEQWANDFLTKQLPTIDNYGHSFDYQEAGLLANRARVDLRLGERPGESLCTVLEEEYGIKIFYLDLGQLGTAACAKSSLFGEAILLNSQCSRWRRNFDLAHELFHLLTWERFGHTGGVCEPSVQEEKLANCFAANLLLPYEAVKEAIHKYSDESGSISLSKLDGIARQFDVSLESLLWRMRFLYNWKEEQAKKYVDEAKEYVRQTQRKDDSCPSVYPERYRALAINVFRKGDMSTGQLAKYLNIGRKEAQQYLSRDVDYEIPTSAA